MVCFLGVSHTVLCRWRSRAAAQILNHGVRAWRASDDAVDVADHLADGLERTALMIPATARQVTHWMVVCTA